MNIRSTSHLSSSEGAPPHQLADLLQQQHCHDLTMQPIHDMFALDDFFNEPQSLVGSDFSDPFPQPLLKGCELDADLVPQGGELWGGVDQASESVLGLSGLVDFEHWINEPMLGAFHFLRPWLSLKATKVWSDISRRHLTQVMSRTTPAPRGPDRSQLSTRSSVSRVVPTSAPFAASVC